MTEVLADIFPLDRHHVAEQPDIQAQVIGQAVGKSCPILDSVTDEDLLRITLSVAATAALGLAQVGEFSFVLGTSAVATGAIDMDAWEVLLGASVLTMMVTPALVAWAPAFGGWLGRRRGAGQPDTTHELSGELRRLKVGRGRGPAGRPGGARQAAPAGPGGPDPVCCGRWPAGRRPVTG